MIPSTHMLVGACIGARAAEQKLSKIRMSLIATASHFVLDAIPHFEPRELGGNYTTFGTPSFSFTVIDHAVGVAALVIIIRSLKLPPRLVVLSAFCAWVPDVFYGLAYAGWWTRFGAEYYASAHDLIHWWKPWYESMAHPWVFGTAFTAITVGASIRYLLGFYSPSRELESVVV